MVKVTDGREVEGIYITDPVKEKACVLNGIRLVCNCLGIEMEVSNAF